MLLPGVTTRKGRRAIARRHLERVLARAGQFHRAMDRPGAPPGTDMFLVVGTGLDTPATAVMDTETRELETSVYEEGDGVVQAGAGSDGGMVRDPIGQLRFGGRHRVGAQ